MTLPPSRLGDKGQRYVLQLKGYPHEDTDEWQDALFTDVRRSAIRAQKGFKQHPCVADTRIKDRKKYDG